MRYARARGSRHGLRSPVDGSAGRRIGGGVALVGVVYFRAVPSGSSGAFAAGRVFGLALVVVSLALLVALPRTVRNVRT